MANELTGWLYVLVNCPGCGEYIELTWAPGDREDKLLQHGDCESFGITYRQAAIQVLRERHVREEQGRKGGAGL